MAELVHRISLWIVPRIFVLLIHLWFRTCRIEIRGQEYLEKTEKEGPGIATFWHYSFVYCFYHLRKYSAAVMVSASKDGEYIARVAQLMGFLPVRGSSNRKGVQALRQMIQAVQKGYNCGIVADGSQGPPRKVQPGCILIASKTGCPIIPIVWAARPLLTFNSWDKTVLPLPFSSIVLQYGEPMEVPAGIDGQQVEQYREKLEQQMNHLYDDVWKKVGLQCHEKKD
ncbi:lysophospholipid acyltransferase family protein [Desulfogranum japonicum]|uniref:lysophospholipid acyltransferase family protein n=1 Tax=Desulfogranum japonicum TaxID=231447 RepID=UPI000685AD69|nr:lysophospholipid acyltransferase family protein [Desulfogranum japonicum]